MARYYKVIEGGYITAVGEGVDGETIAKEEYDAILGLIANRPVPEAGYDYILKTDLTWELIEAPVVTEDEPEATESDYIAALAELGVNVNEES